MIRKKLSAVPVEKGNWVSFGVICGYFGYVLGFASQPVCAMWFAA